MATQNPLIILGSSRRNGSTLQAIDSIRQTHAVPLVDLSDMTMSYYDYDNFREQIFQA